MIDFSDSNSAEFHLSQRAQIRAMRRSGAVLAAASTVCLAIVFSLPRPGAQGPAVRATGWETKASAAVDADRPAPSAPTVVRSIPVF